MGNTNPPSPLPMKAVTLLASEVDLLGWLSWFIPHPDYILSVFPSFLPLESKTFLDTKFLGGHILSYPRTTPVRQPPRALPELTKPQASLLLPVPRPRPMWTPRCIPRTQALLPLESGSSLLPKLSMEKRTGPLLPLLLWGFPLQMVASVMSDVILSHLVTWVTLFLLLCVCLQVFMWPNVSVFPLWFLLSLHSKKITITVIMISPDIWQAITYLFCYVLSYLSC